MQIEHPYSPAKLFELPAGSLAYVQRPSGRALVIILKAKTADNKGVVLAVLTPEGFNAPTPCHVGIERDLDCLAFGEWWIEGLDDPSAWPRNRAFADSPGALHLEANATLINLDAHPSNQMQSELTINLNTLDFSDVPQSATPISRWRIWIGGRTAKEEPLFEYEAKPR